MGSLFRHDYPEYDFGGLRHVTVDFLCTLAVMKSSFLGWTTELSG